MSDNARGNNRVASYRHSGRDRPHEPKRLKDVVPHRRISDVAERTDFSIEYVVPCGHDNSSQMHVRMSMRPL